MLISFYVVCFVVFNVLFYLKTQLKIKSFLLSLLVVLVGSEYYEIPIFVCGYLGVAGYQFPHILNHVLILIAFAIFASEIQLSKKGALILIVGPILTAPLLLMISNLFLVYLARIIGFGILVTVAINSPGVGGRKSRKP